MMIIAANVADFSEVIQLQSTAEMVLKSGSGRGKCARMYVYVCSVINYNVHTHTPILPLRYQGTYVHTSIHRRIGT